MSELDTIKLFFKTQFEKHPQMELGFRYEYDSTTETHIIEISNETLSQQDDFRLESFEFAMNFIEQYGEFVLFLNPSDPVHLSRVDYSENNFYIKDNYVSNRQKKHHHSSRFS